MIITKIVELSELVVKISSNLINVFCIVILVINVINAIKSLVINKFSEAKNTLTSGINTALTFNLAGEVMKIVVSREMKELYMIGGILILKVIIAFLLHFEDKWECERDMHEEKGTNTSRKKTKK